ncbi:MAG: hypothetical protein PVG39_22940 [Desulfobacteraceae bacterium]|jgi:hypothetical protein
MRVFTFFLGILLIAGVSFAADIDGKWSGVIPQFGGFSAPGGGQTQPMVTIFGFKADGETLTGYNVPAGMNIQVPIREGIVKGSKIWFLLDINMGPSKMVFRYKGKVKGDKIKLSLKTVTENQEDADGFMMGEQQITLKRVN